MKAAGSLLLLFCLAMTAVAVPGPATAHGDHDHHEMGTPTVQQNTGTGAVYVEIRNDDDAPDRLLGATTDAAQSVELHSMEMDDGIMRMVPEPDGLEIDAHDSVTLEPQGGHLMLVNLTHDLRPGTTYGLTLEFENAGSIEVQVTVAVERPPDIDPITAGGITIDTAWSLPAPMLSTDPAAPGATPGTH